jgi:hypothetical protein
VIKEQSIQAALYLVQGKYIIFLHYCKLLLIIPQGYVLEIKPEWLHYHDTIGRL